MGCFGIDLHREKELGDCRPLTCPTGIFVSVANLVDPGFPGHGIVRRSAVRIVHPRLSRSHNLRIRESLRSTVGIERPIFTAISALV